MFLRYLRGVHHRRSGDDLPGAQAWWLCGVRLGSGRAAHPCETWRRPWCVWDRRRPFEGAVHAVPFPLICDRSLARRQPSATLAAAHATATGPASVAFACRRRTDAVRVVCGCCGWSSVPPPYTLITCQATVTTFVAGARAPKRKVEESNSSCLQSRIARSCSQPPRYSPCSRRLPPHRRRSRRRIRREASPRSSRL